MCDSPVRRAASLRDRFDPESWLRRAALCLRAGGRAFFTRRGAGRLATLAVGKRVTLASLALGFLGADFPGALWAVLGAGPAIFLPALLLLLHLPLPLL